MTFSIQLDQAKVNIQGISHLSRYVVSLVMQDLKKHLDTVLREMTGVHWETMLVGNDLTVSCDTSEYTSQLAEWLGIMGFG
eukprot:CAMPEP_0168578490 /NCGR_PEP_ID=MMETSP0413-20121227/21360_1 /TAXON_ID=136452 /ORGANISM="Filamoeba nolandi, Strain NC-AS-23-1" /LENGTH=80 /DNA_ID=CAMNT_0008612339 /DNA_START=307 /DNA_END=546 /DNA_ORIENTATION=-